MKKFLHPFTFALTLILFLGMGSCNSDDCGDPNTSYSAVTSVSYESTGFYYTAAPEYLVTPIVNNSISYYAYAIQMKPSISTYGICPDVPNHADKIQNIEIYCLQDFNSTHPIGSNVTSYFDVIDEQYMDGEFRIDIQEYLADMPVFPSEMFLILNEAPTDSANHQFKVKLTLAGQGIDTFEFTTIPVNITTN